MRRLAAYGDSKAVVPLAMTQSFLERLNKLAMERGVNRSALIREAIEQTFFGKETSESSEEVASHATPGGA